jgi:hypothetical protein
MPKVNATPEVNAIGQQVKAMLGNPIPADPVLVIGADESQALLDFGKLSFKGKQSTKKLVELLWNNGKRSYHFVGSNDEDASLMKFRASIIAGIVKGYDDDAQKIINANPDTLSITQQALRKIFFNENIQTDYGNIKKAMVKFEEGKLSGKTEKAKPATPEQMVRYYVDQAIAQIGKVKNGYEGMLKDKEVLSALAVRKQVKPKA